MSSSNVRQRNPYRATYVPRSAVTTNHYGTTVPNESNERKLLRLTMANMLWENQFYLNGEKTGDLVAKLVKSLDAAYVAKVAEAARSTFKLRHVPLLLMRELARNSRLKAETLAVVIQRPDEMGEFVSLYWKDGKQPLTNQVKKGLAAAFSKFSEYQLAKWDKNSAAVKLRDVLFLSHPKPTNVAQELLFKKIANKQLETPDTWETELSAGADKKSTFVRLMTERKLGALAFLRNLRNMRDAGVSDDFIRAYSADLNVDRVLPFRYIAAARIVPEFEDMLEAMMFRSLATMEKLKGKTKLYIDVSGSMFGPKVNAKSDLDRFDAAAALAMLCREICDDVEIYSFSNYAVRVPPRRGFALREVISNSQHHAGTDLGRSLNSTGSPADRVIVFTDGECTAPSKPAFNAAGYLINVAAYENSVSHKDWLEVNGFSEAVISYIQAVENESSFL